MANKNKSEMSYLRLAMLTDPKEVALARGIIRELANMASKNPDLDPHHHDLIDYVRKQIGDYDRESYVIYLHDYLHHTGVKKNTIPPRDHDLAMSLCDGYGKLTVEQLLDKGLSWDWSHVRDSSLEAASEAVAFIEGIGKS